MSLHVGTISATVNSVAPQCASTNSIVKTERILSSLKLSFFYVYTFMADGVRVPTGHCSLINDASSYVRRPPSNSIEVADLIRGFAMYKLPNLILLTACALALIMTAFVLTVPGAYYS